MNNQTFETNKTEKYTVSALIKKIDNGQILFNHPAQREADQWSLKMKSNLISDILQGNPIPALVLAEQVINGMSIIWNLDGKQRCTNVYDYVNDSFKINKSVRRNIIKYQSILKDSENRIIKDENGMPKIEWKEFDIVNKKFSQLPDELKDKILDYCFDATLFLNCTDEEIIYNIERYNDGKPMNQAQKGIIRLGNNFANKVKTIAKNDFFVDCGSYTSKEERNGAIDRVIAETVMASNFLDDWKKKQEDMCEFLYENATDEMFDLLDEELDALSEIVNDDHDELFNSKDSFIWFTVFHRAMSNGVTEEKFIELLNGCSDLYREIEYNGETLNSLNVNRNTKDKSTILKKINHIEYLLYGESTKVA